MSELLAAARGAPLVAVSPTAPPRWGQLPSSSTVIRATFWLGKLSGVLDALVAAAADAGVRPAVSGPAGAGALYACLDPRTSDDAATAFVRGLRDRLTSGAEVSSGPRGSVVVLTAPAEVLAAVDTYGPVPGAALMRAVKDRFDPGYRMFPGRLAGGS